MTINFEVKKDGMRQTQDGLWKLTLTVLPEDMPVDLLQAPMGTPYGLAMVKIDYDNPDIGIPTTEQTEGDKLRVRAIMLCKDANFFLFLNITNNAAKDFSDIMGLRASGYLESASKEEVCIMYLYRHCNIKSRGELTHNKEAQEKFKLLDQQYKDWQNYKENLDKY